MSTPLPLSRDLDEPLGLLRRETGAPDPGLTRLSFEFSSRGDRVPGHLLLPSTAGGPFPLVLVQTGELRESAADFSETALAWSLSGAAVLGIDLPLQGERASSKLTARLAGGLGQPAGADETWEVLWDEFLRQAAHDASRSLDAADALAPIEASRIVYVGCGLASVVAAQCCAADARPCAVALAPGDGKAGACELRALEAASAIAPRPVLVVESAGGMARSLLDAAGEPKQSVSATSAGNRAAHAALDPFVREHLGIQASAS